MVNFSNSKTKHKAAEMYAKELKAGKLRMTTITICYSYTWYISWSAKNISSVFALPNTLVKVLAKNLNSF